MEKKSICSKILLVFTAGLIIYFTGFLGHGFFWGIHSAFGYGGGGGGETELPEEILAPKPTIDDYMSETTDTFIILKGTRGENTTIYINNASDNVIYPGDLLWQSLRSLNLGQNIFNIYAKDSAGNISETVTAAITRYKIGDINRDGYVDDLDLALLAAHWAENWPKADINNDKIIDDLDLAVLASHWDL